MTWRWLFENLPFFRQAREARDAAERNMRRAEREMSEDLQRSRP
jgi:hypothetical protein